MNSGSATREVDLALEVRLARRDLWARRLFRAAFRTGCLFVPAAFLIGHFELIRWGLISTCLLLSGAFFLVGRNVSEDSEPNLL